MSGPRFRLSDFDLRKEGDGWAITDKATGGGLTIGPEDVTMRVSIAPNSYVSLPLPRYLLEYAMRKIREEECDLLFDAGYERYGTAGWWRLRGATGRSMTQAEALRLVRKEQADEEV